MTGGGRGLCNPAGARYPLGRGRGAGAGRGFGRGYGYGPGRGYGRAYRFRGVDPLAGDYYGPEPFSTAPFEEINTLRAETEAIKGSLEEIKQRLAEIQKDTGNK